MRTPHRARRPLVALVALVVALIVGYLVQASGSGDRTSSPSGHPTATADVSRSNNGGVNGNGVNSAGVVALSSLPPQVGQTVALIRAGGPFPYPRNDGVIFHDYEHTLPRESDGYYHEFTVPTPGSDDRGARRVVVGRDGRYWYTGDHYDTFHQVDVTG